ncbi:MAG TPA: phosphatidate cytidylyltransferase [Bryobacteraceae bacterium]|nr:phosphatidate cytidylyltransferase [Bryobacteraceae bacterium]
MKRILTGLVLTPLIVWIVLWGPHLAFLAVLTAVAVLCFYEYSGIVAAYGVRKPGPAGYAAGLILLFAQGDAALYVVLATLLLLAAAVFEDDLKQALPRAALTLAGVLYIFGVWRYAAILRLENQHWLMFALALSWAGDVAALYIGKTFGRHRLAPVVSPKKSWEGALASVAASMLFGVLYATNLIPGTTAVQAALFAAAGNMAGQLGDLAESAMKRGAGVKDSGTMLPGHGGWLDRVDSSLFAVPVVYFLVLYFG